MPKKAKLGKGRQDKYYFLAKEQGYRSRAAFKLVQLNKKYNFLGGARVLIDLCAAPGGWLQVAAKYMPVSSIIIGVDLVPIKPIHNVITIIDDITTESCRSKLKKELKTWQVDVVVHDGAPNVGKAWLHDAYSQSELTLHSLRLATEFLVRGGTFVTKVFRSAEYNSLLFVFSQLFKKVEATKPSASRNTSAEIYVVCKGFLAPKKIDPKLLDPRFAFQEIEQHVASATALYKKNNKPNRSGYKADGIIYRQTTLGEFVLSNSPVMTLADNFVLVWDDAASQKYASQPEFNDELKHCCQDLHVLSKSEFKKLLHFREKMRKRFPTEEDLAEQAEKEQEEAAKKVVREPTEEEAEEELDTALESELQQLQKKSRRERKKKNKARQRIHERHTLEMHHTISAEDFTTKENLFDLAAIHSAPLFNEVAIVPEAPKSGDLDIYFSSDEEPQQEEEESDPEESDTEKYTRRLEAELDEDYRRYCDRRGKKVEKQAPPGMKLKEKPAPEPAVWERLRDQLEEEKNSIKPKTALATTQNPLIVREPAIDQATTAAKVESWYTQDLFQDLLDPSSSSHVAAVQVTKQSALTRAMARAEEKKRMIKDFEADDDEDENNDDDDDDSSGDERQKQKEARRRKREREFQRENFQIVPLSSSDDDDDDFDPKAFGIGGRPASSAASSSSPAANDYESDSSSDDEDLGDDSNREDSDAEEDSSDYEYDLEAAQEVLAYAKGLIRSIGKIDPSKIVDDSYNRWAQPDNEIRPSWFNVDHQEHEKPQLPVTKADIEEMRARAKAVDARPIKKIAEAQARKRRRMQAKMAKLKEKAKQIAGSNDMTDRAKLRAVEKMVAKGMQTKKKEKFYVVRTKRHLNTKIPKAPGNSRVYCVDRRLKCDKRARKIRERKSQKRRRQK